MRNWRGNASVLSAMSAISETAARAPGLVDVIAQVLHEAAAADVAISVPHEAAVGAALRAAGAEARAAIE